MNVDHRFLGGVIEGFYGPPWSPAERLRLFHWMNAWGLNTYLYGPKDDLKDRALWRELYSESEASELRALITSSQEHQLQFIFALSPGLDIRYSEAADRDRLKEKFAQLISLGCSYFCLLFDDIPDAMHPADLERWGSLAAAQAAVTNEIFCWTRQQRPGARFFFCPTPYCDRMASRGLGGQDYLEILGRTLEPEIDVFWTGPEIISEQISVAQARELRRVLRRKPMLWENLHANDYDGRRFFCGPYAGRPREIRDELSGLLCNPNCELLLNYVPLRTVGQFVHSEGEWDPRQAYLRAIREWLIEFETVGAPINFEDLVLFGDCFYLPYGEGTEAETLMALTQKLLQGDPAAAGEDLARFRERANRLKVCCGSLANLKNRPLCHALYRRVWELREELDLLQRCVEQRADPAKRDEPCRSDFHLPGTYRGGMVAQLQTFLQQEPDGAFIVAPHHM